MVLEIKLQQKTVAIASSNCEQITINATEAELNIESIVAALQLPQQQQPLPVKQIESLISGKD